MELGAGDCFQCALRQTVSPSTGTSGIMCGKQEAVLNANGATKQVYAESTGSGVIEVCRGNFVATVEPYVRSLQESRVAAR